MLQRNKAAHFMDPDLHTMAQERGSLKGLLPVGTPTSKASFPAFCRQYCWSSAAAWDTWEQKQKNTLRWYNFVTHIYFKRIFFKNTQNTNQVQAFWFLGCAKPKAYMCNWHPEFISIYKSRFDRLTNSFI